MKTTLGAIAGVIVGFSISTVLAPRSGKETRRKLNKDLDYRLFKLQLAYYKLALQLGINTRAKIAEMTQARIEKDHQNAAKGNPDPYTNRDEETVQQAHEKEQAKKAVDGPTAKSHLRQVPDKSK